VGQIHAASVELPQEIVAAVARDALQSVHVPPDGRRVCDGQSVPVNAAQEVRTQRLGDKIDRRGPTVRRCRVGDAPPGRSL